MAKELTKKQIINKIAQSIQIVGWGQVARDIRKETTYSGVKRHVDYVVNRELAVGKGCKYLTDPITRKRTLNPRRKKWLKYKRKMNTALNILKRKR